MGHQPDEAPRREDDQQPAMSDLVKDAGRTISVELLHLYRQLGAL